MEITDVRIKLTQDPQDRLLAFCSITLDGCFVVRDLKIILGGKGPFVAMPSRKLTDHCPRCRIKNNLRSCYCQQCGQRLGDDRALKGIDGRARLYSDIAHPINSLCRDLIQERVLEGYERELILSQQPGYVSQYDEFGDEGEYDEHWVEPTTDSPAAQVDGLRVDVPTTPKRGPHRRSTLARNNDRKPRETVDFGDGIL